jgi:hypothetical protein
MNTTTIFLAIGVAAALTLVVAPTLSSSAFADKTVTQECTQGGRDLGTTCPGESGGQNPNRNEECSVTGGGGDIVQGQQKKICG